MSLVVVGLNHRTVPVGLLERMAVAPEALPKALQALGGAEHLAEVVLLSTCNRTEVYANATLFHPAMQEVRDFLADSSGVDPDEFADLLYTYHDDAAVAHLFGVAAGLDSMIIGEGEILGQVREAWNAAEHEARHRSAAHRAPSATRSRWASGPAPRPPSAGTRCRCRRPRWRWPPAGSARSTTGGCSCSAPGAWARAWPSRSPAPASSEIVVANRTADEGRRSSPPGSVGGPSPSTRSPTRWSRATCCSRPPARRTSWSSAARSKTVMQARDGRALLVVDIGVPRNIDPGAGEVFGVTLLDIDDLRAFGEQSLAQRRQEIGHVREIIAEELDRHRVERTAREVAPIITALRAHVDDVRAARARASARQARRPRPRRARGRRAAHPQHRQQAPARADGAREGRRRHGARRALRRRARRAVRPRLDVADPDH